MISEHFRGHREALGDLSARGGGEGKNRKVYDAKNLTILPGKLVREEAKRATTDRAVNEAYDASGLVHDFFLEVMGRESINDRAMDVDSTVHYGKKYDNAFWNGRQMVYGDGDGELFKGFTGIDIVGHELSHGVTQYEANLEYQGESGALNESISDVFGSLVKQWSRKEKAEDANWIIGEGIFTSKVDGIGLRSMKAPGTAYEDRILGKDLQPDHMKNYNPTEEDNGGVHINSGIPNHAFYLAAVGLGGNAWEKMGKIWYLALKDYLGAKSSFKDAVQATLKVAANLFGATSKEKKIVTGAWKAVGLEK